MDEHSPRRRGKTTPPPGALVTRAAVLNVEPEHATFNALEHGLWAWYRSGSEVNHGAWMRACSEGQPVGNCRLCGKNVAPTRPFQVGTRRVDYEARCVNPDCGWTMLAPYGRILRYSSRASERIGDG